MYRVLSIGSITTDLFFPTDEGVILKTPDDITSQVKVAFELGGKFRVADRSESIGGVAANVAIGLSRLGIPSGCYSSIGRDRIGETITATLQKEGVDHTLVQTDPNAKSDLSAIIVIAQSGDRIIFHNRDASERLRIDEGRLKGKEWCYVSALNGAWRDNLRVILETAERTPIKIACNPGQHNLKDDPGLILELIRASEILFLNKDEAIELLLVNAVETRPEKLNDERFLVEALHKIGPAMVALTDGKRGAWATDGKALWHAESYEPHGLKDTTGAGDAFGSGFFAAYIKGLSLETCLRYGIVNAGSVVGFYGATAGLLDQETATDIIIQVKSQQLR